MTSRNTRGGVQRQDSEETVRNPKAPNPPAYIEKLKGSENWTVWKRMIVLFLRTHALLSYIESPTPIDDLDDESVEVREDAHVMACLAAVMESSVISVMFNSVKIAHDLWRNLCSAYENQGVPRRLSLLYKLLHTKRTDFSTVRAYATDLQGTVEQIRASSEDNLDEVAAAAALSNLRKEEDDVLKRFLEQTCTTIVNGKPKLSFDRVIEDLLKEALKEEQDDAPAQAMLVHQGSSRGGYANFRGGFRGQRRGRGSFRGRGGWGGNTWSGNGKNGAKVFPPCIFCSRTNHPKDECRDRKRKILEESKRKQSDQGPTFSGESKIKRTKGPAHWELNSSKSDQGGSAKMGKRSGSALQSLQDGKSLALNS